MIARMLIRHPADWADYLAAMQSVNPGIFIHTARPERFPFVAASFIHVQEPSFSSPGGRPSIQHEFFEINKAIELLGITSGLWFGSQFYDSDDFTADAGNLEDALVFLLDRLRARSTFDAAQPRFGEPGNAEDLFDAALTRVVDRANAKVSSRKRKRKTADAPEPAPAPDPPAAPGPPKREDLIDL